MSNSVPPSVTYPSPNEWPNSVRVITGITKEANARVTSPLHGFTSADENITVIDFHQVKGMIQINTLPATILKIIDPNNFTINLNTSDFFTYTSGGQLIIVAGNSPYDPYQNVL